MNAKFEKRGALRPEIPLTTPKIPLFIVVLAYCLGTCGGERVVQELRQRAEVFTEFATNLLIEAERLETMLQSMRNAHNTLVRSGHMAVREFERRQRKAQESESE